MKKLITNMFIDTVVIGGLIAAGNWFLGVFWLIFARLLKHSLVEKRKELISDK